MKPARRLPQPVWDLPTRLFHLGLMAAVGGCWYSYRAEEMALHRLFGEAAAGLMAFRLYWGVVGGSTARFRRMVASPLAVWRYVKGRGAPVVGHNPLGSWSVVLLLALVSVQIATGLLSVDSNNLAPGPLSNWVSQGTSDLALRLHALTFKFLKGFLALHLVAVLVHELRGDHLVLAMLHGRKQLRVASTVRFVPWWYALPGAAAALLFIGELWRLGPQ